MTITRRRWIQRALLGGLALLVAEQTWRHGHEYIFAEEFAEVEAGKLYRGAWQKPWPMRRLVRDYKIKTVVALAHPPTHPLAIQERDMAESLGYQWVHIPIVDERGTGDPDVISDKLEKAANVMADPANQPVYFHCHHGINRASMAQMAYRMLHSGWTLDQATDEIAQTFGLKEVSRGPDYRHMARFYQDRVLPRRAAEAAAW
jgi:protein tyrosine phosphatase (PTP) superfamily phosphohydrolase (DUF442 family)